MGKSKEMETINLLSVTTPWQPSQAMAVIREKGMCGRTVTTMTEKTDRMTMTRRQSTAATTT